MGFMLLTSFTPQAAAPYFDKVLSRQYTRLRKAGVQPWTWLQSHLQLCALVLPLAELEAVMAAKGEWSAVASEISILMSCGTLGGTIFTFAGLMVNAAQYRTKIEQLLDTLFDDEDITEEASLIPRLLRRKQRSLSRPSAATSNHTPHEVNSDALMF